MLNAEHCPRKKKQQHLIQWMLAWQVSMMLSQSITSTLSVWENAFIKKIKDNFFLCILPCVSSGAISERIVR